MSTQTLLSSSTNKSPFLLFDNHIRYAKDSWFSNRQPIQHDLVLPDVFGVLLSLTTQTDAFPLLDAGFSIMVVGPSRSVLLIL